MKERNRSIGRVETLDKARTADGLFQAGARLRGRDRVDILQYLQPTAFLHVSQSVTGASSALNDLVPVITDEIS